MVPVCPDADPWALSQDGPPTVWGCFSLVPVFLEVLAWATLA